MSMVCSIVGLSSAQIARLRGEPHLSPVVIELLNDEAIATFLQTLLPSRPQLERERLENELKGVQERIASAQCELAAFGPFESILNLEKSWHMLHYLFTGKADEDDAPAGSLFAGGDEVGPDVGYGPARILDVATVRQYSIFLDSLDVRQLKNRVDLEQMDQMHVYGMPTGPRPTSDHEDELREEVSTYFPLLRAYAGKMSQLEYGILIWLS